MKDTCEVNYLTSKYRIIKCEQVDKERIEFEKELNEIINLPYDAISMIARLLNFNKGRILERYQDDSEQCLRDLHIDSWALIKKDNDNNSKNNFNCNTILPSNINYTIYYKPNTNDKFNCPVCFMDIPSTHCIISPCKHRFCIQCWIDYIYNSLSNYRNFVCLPCMEYKCEQIISDSQFKTIIYVAISLGIKYTTKYIEPIKDTIENNNSNASITLNKKYVPPIQRFIRLFTSHNKIKKNVNNSDNNLLRDSNSSISTKKKNEEIITVPSIEELWNKYQLVVRKIFIENKNSQMLCRNPNCNYIIYGFPNTKSIECICKQTGCFQCKFNEAHEPLNCITLHKWEEQCKKDLQSVEWMFANTKKCPQCFVRIEKNSGCNHMTCTNCHYEFCWICDTSWKQHIEESNNDLNPYHCNRYDPRKINTNYNDNNTLINNNINDDTTNNNNQIQKYLFYFTRYYNQEMNKQFLIQRRDLISNISQKIIKAQRYSIPPHLENVIIDANEELIISRRILKYSYAYGFFLTDQQKITLLEFQQERLESLTDTLLNSIYHRDINTIKYNLINNQLQLLRKRIVHFIDTIN